MPGGIGADHAGRKRHRRGAVGLRDPAQAGVDVELNETEEEAGILGKERVGARAERHSQRRETRRSIGYPDNSGGEGCAVSGAQQRDDVGLPREVSAADGSPA